MPITSLRWAHGADHLHEVGTKALSNKALPANLELRTKRPSDTLPYGGAKRGWQNRRLMAHEAVQTEGARPLPFGQLGANEAVQDRLFFLNPQAKKAPSQPARAPGLRFRWVLDDLGCSKLSKRKGPGPLRLDSFGGPCDSNAENAEPP